MQVTYILDDKLGGVTSLNLNLASNCPYGDTEQIVIMLDQDNWNVTRSGKQFPVHKQVMFKYSAFEGSYSMLKRLREQIPDSPGALVVNYGTEMAMLDHHEVKQTVYQLVHDDFNVRLAEKYEYLVDCFVCHNRFIREKLEHLLPSRKSDIYFLPHGVPIPQQHRVSGGTAEKIRLLFIGRMVASKGIFDLPGISSLLEKEQVPFEWTLIGNGPELDNLKACWNPSHPVTFCQPASQEELIRICANHDLFVLPTKFEGSPVSLLEAMSAGLVPVITALPGGIMEVVTGETGYSIPAGDLQGFARAIRTLHENRAELESKSKASRELMVSGYDVRNTAAEYHRLFRDFGKHHRPKKIRKMKVGTKIDQYPLPGALTFFIKKLMYKHKLSA